MHRRRAGAVPDRGRVLIAAIALVAGSGWLGYKARKYVEAFKAVRRLKRNERLLKAYEEVQHGKLGPGGAYRTGLLSGARRADVKDASLRLEALHVEVIKHVCECRDCQSLLTDYQARKGTNSSGPDSGRRGERTTPARRLPGMGVKVST